MKLSGELEKKKIHKEAAFAVAKCAELFIEYLAEQSLAECRKRGRAKTVGKQVPTAQSPAVRDSSRLWPRVTSPATCHIPGHVSHPWPRVTSLAAF